jgi:Asp-tRNA(Asn)/Glu-tRNA(Gln) amidotransferase A subunit family amidase
LADDGLATLSATEAVAEMARGAVSAEEYTRACLDRIAADEDRVKAFAHLDPEHALTQARERDEWRQTGRMLGPLHGVPVAIKDIIDTEGYPTECGSPLLAGRTPDRDATVVSKLLAAGAVIIGKTVTTEFAYFHPGPTRNPLNPERTPGGSSSGSAAAVAAGMVPLAIGSQTNGSIIRPASFCGAFAMKPSHGLVSRAGALSLSRTLDHIGPFARTLDDLALMIDAMAGFDPADPDTRPQAAPACVSVLAREPPVSPRFGFMRTPIWDEKISPESAEAFDELCEAIGERVEPAELPDYFAKAWAHQRTIMSADMAHNLRVFAERGGDTISQALRDFLAEGSEVPAVDYLAALDEARALSASFAGYFQRYDAIITPATTGVAPKGLERTGDPAFCTMWTLFGLPAVTLPLLEGEDGMPIGVQLIGQAGDDARLLRTARALVQQLAEVE